MGNLCSRAEAPDWNQHLVVSHKVLLKLGTIIDDLETRCNEQSRDFDHNEVKLAQAERRLLSGEISKMKYAALVRPLYTANLELTEEIALTSRDVAKNQAHEAKVRAYMLHIDRTAKLESIASDLRLIGIADDDHSDRVHDDVHDVLARMTSVSDSHVADVNSVGGGDQYEDIVNEKINAAYARLADEDVLRIKHAPTALRALEEDENEYDSEEEKRVSGATPHLLAVHDVSLR